MKPYPSGRASHAALGKLHELAPDPNAVAAIELACPPLIRRLVDRPYDPAMRPAWARLCLPWLAALMLTDRRIDPRRFSAADIADPRLGTLAGKVRLVDDRNPDPNALFPQRLSLRLHDTHVEDHVIAHTLGSPQNPLSTAQAADKLTLAREIAPPDADARLFIDPLAYFTEPR
ncbi:MmgE/PrpD family protein [Leptolyngbya sp. 15MV]|nr:MmgE/PrpD family protein [Leptolyngbya sp. 15MV]